MEQFNLGCLMWFGFWFECFTKGLQVVWQTRTGSQCPDIRFGLHSILSKAIKNNNGQNWDSDSAFVFFSPKFRNCNYCIYEANLSCGSILEKPGFPSCRLIAILYRYYRELDVQLCQMGQKICCMVTTQFLQTRPATFLDEMATVLLIMQKLRPGSP